MKKWWLLLLTMGVGPACQMFCNTTSCGCGGPPKAGFYDIEGVSLVALNGSGGSGTVLTTGNTVPLALLKLRLAPVTRYFTSRTPHPGGAGVAWACSPADPEFVEQLDSVLVRSRYAYDARHPAGTSLNDLLLAGDYSGNLLPDYLRLRAGTPDESLILRLSTAPAAAGPQQLVVRYRLRNGEVYTAETPVFNIQP
ncbi:hypothetical protein EJV47_08405 [Hymenobacter gummosus]|uniref:DUF5034 domain-containing protein n=1 Tax=Hymenobacter gummosus TaxID=1776032 RepID=A0A3S0K6A6_9BACT|nr:hypothetical protein [Hymenobacter gummosus]RTQ50646.1 hypothetical protein EJV47_08405 [Hymenobacter gummosus]